MSRATCQGWEPSVHGTPSMILSPLSRSGWRHGEGRGRRASGLGAKPRHQRMDPQRQRQREAGGGGNSAARRGRRCARRGATGARAEGQREPLRKLRGAPGLNATPARTRAQAAEAFLLMGGSCSRGGVLTQGPLREARWGRCMPGWGVRSGLPVQPLPCAANPRAKDSSRIAAGRGPAIGL